MLNANSLRKNTKKDIIKSVCEEIEKTIIRYNEDGEKQISISVERNGWFECTKGIEPISWGLIINEVIKYFKNNGFLAELLYSRGTISYTRELIISW